MSTNRLEPYLPPSSLGDKLLACCHRLKMDAWKITADEDSDLAEADLPMVDFEIHGSLPADEDGARMLAALVNQLRKQGGGR